MFLGVSTECVKFNKITVTYLRDNALISAKISVYNLCIQEKIS